MRQRPSWVYTRLAQKKMPKSQRMHTLTYKVPSKLKNLFIISFIFIPLSSNKNLCFSFCSFLFIFLTLDAQKCLTSRVLMTSPWASKSVKQVDDAFSIYAIAQKERMQPLKATGSSILHFKRKCSINGVGPPLYPTRWHIRGSWQLFKCLCCLWNSA